MGCEKSLTEACAATLGTGENFLYLVCPWILIRRMGYMCLPSPDLKKFNLDMLVSSGINKSNVVAHRCTHLAVPTYKLVVSA